MNQVQTIAAITVREIAGKRLFLVVFVGIMLLLVAGVLVAPLNIGESHKLFYDLGFAFMAFFLLLFVLLEGGRQIAGNRENGGFYWLLAKPVKRWQVIVGIFVGLALLVGACLVLLGGFFIIVLAMAGLPIQTSLFVPLGFLYLKYLLLLGLVILLGTSCSLFSTIFFSLGLFIVGHGTAMLLNVAAQSGLSTRLPALILYHLLPDFSAFHLASAGLHQQLPSAGVLGQLAVYGLSYLVIVLGLSCWRFSRVDLD
jgi:ABC-type transport system involved in multi-copper enzyme maturation permease subunit